MRDNFDKKISAALWLVEECGLSRSLLDELCYGLPSTFSQQVNSWRTANFAYRQVRTQEWLKKPFQRMLASDVVNIYMTMYPKNKTLAKSVDILQLQNICRVLKIKYKNVIPGDFRADHVHKTLTLMREGTLNVNQCFKCHTSHVSSALQVVRVPCPVCTTITNLKSKSSKYIVKDASLKRSAT